MIGDIHGQTPLHLSLILGYESIAHLFMDHSSSKLDQNDLTDIRLAIQCGHTSTIEKLVSEGADLNIQSPDGQTCLHKAIKLCYKSEKIVQETDTLRNISNDYYRGELSPEKALVFYLLDNGAKVDVKDERGNLPIQYAKVEVIKQMILWRLPSLEEIKSYRDEPSTHTIVSVEVERNTSQEIELKDNGVSMCIPPEAVHQGDPCKITLTLLRDLQSVDIQDDESVVCYGIRCDPPNIIFHQPVKIKIPHFTLAINPDQVKPDIVYHVWDSVNGRFGRRNLAPSQILKDKIKFRTCHLQVWALSSTDLQGLQLRCVVFQSLFMTPAEKPTLRVYLLHPYMDYIEDIRRKEKSSSVPYCQVLKEFTFSIDSNTRDLKIWFDDGTKRNKRMIPIKSIISGKCSPLDFELQFFPEEKGNKNGHIDILQGSSTRAEKEFIVSIEDEPDYAVDHTDSQGRLQYVSNNLLEILADVIHTPKDVISFGYQLGLSYSSMKKYNHPADVDFKSVSRSGFGEMLRDWRRQVRPSEQVDELHLALQNAGLGHAAEVILHKLSSGRRFAQVRQIWESKK